LSGSPGVDGKPWKEGGRGGAVEGGGGGRGGREEGRRFGPDELFAFPPVCRMHGRGSRKKRKGDSRGRGGGGKRGE